MKKKRHGMYYTRFYKIYHAIKQRCEYTNGENYPRYGGKGIKNLWKTFEEFRDDMYESYQAHVEQFGKKDTQIDRIDNNGHYSRENCRWATLKEQARNKSTNRFLKKGKIMQDFVGINGLTQSALSGRINKQGWNIEKALNQPIRKHLITYKGKTKRLSEWARELNISKITLGKRINKLGWSIEKALNEPIRKQI